MTFRERIADRISGGALTRAREQTTAYRDLWRQDRGIATDSLDRLTRIIAEVKPTSNATVRRMGRIAKGDE